MATVQQIMGRPVFGCDPDERATDALEYLQMLNIHAAPVIEPETKKPIGVVSVSDLLGDLGRRTVRDCMSESVTYVAAETTITRAAQVIVETGYHHLVVVDDDERVVGFLSAVDVLRAIVAPPPGEIVLAELPDLEWTTVAKVTDAGLTAAPAGPGVLVLLRVDDEDDLPAITWAESCDDVAERLAELHSDPPARLARLLEADRLRYRATAIADARTRRRVLQRILAHVAHADARER